MAGRYDHVKHIGEAIREEADRRKLKQKAVGKLINGASGATVSRWYSGKQEVLDADNRKAVWRFLGVDTVTAKELILKDYEFRAHIDLNDADLFPPPPDQ